jgi:hypothetical protein
MSDFEDYRPSTSQWPSHLPGDRPLRLIRHPYES